MDDISDFIKSSFYNLQKRAIGLNYQQKTLKDRMNNFNNIRRETRSTLIFQKRQINENMSPINTPEPSKIVKKAVEKKEEKKPNKRLEMLNKWKAEKELRKQEEKRKAKPLFKVCHVPVEVGLPKLEKVNKEIKGKPISQFAPPDHKFHAPKNVQPINFGDKNNSLAMKSKVGCQRLDSLETSKFTPRQKPTVAQKNTKSATHKKVTMGQQKQIIPQIPKVKVDANRENPRSVTAKKPVRINSKSENKGMTQQNSDLSRAPSEFKANEVNSRKKSEPKSKLVIKAKGNVSSKCSPPKKTRKNEKNNVKTDVNSEVLERVTPISSSDKADNNIVERKPRIKQIKDVNEDLMNQGKLKENSARTPRKSRKPANVTTKKTVGWDVIEIVDSDDEVFPKNISSSMPMKTPKKYNKTPRQNKKPETVYDIDAEETKKNDDEAEVEGSSEFTPKNNKKLDDAAPIYISPVVTIVTTPANIVKRMPRRRKMGTKQIRDVKEDDGQDQEEIKENSARIANVKKDDLKNQEELKGNSAKTPQKSRKSVGVTLKKNVDRSAVEIINNDDEAFPKNITSRTPNRTPKKYDKTPKMTKKPDTMTDVDSEETKTNYDEAEIERKSESTAKNNKKPDDTSPFNVSSIITITTTPATRVRRMPKGKTESAQITDLKEDGKELKEDPGKPPQKSRKSAGPKKNVDWNAVDIINSDDEVPVKNLTSRTPNKTPKIHNKTPEITKKPETVTDVDAEETKTNDAEVVERKSLATPKNDNKLHDTSSVYISPFVTISRGKASATKEYQVRHSGNTSDFNKSISDNTSPQAGAIYFTMKLNNEITRIESVCNTWNTYRDANDVPEEANDLIDVAIGQSKLLISKKFQQFRDLIEQCRDSAHLEKAVSCEDLHGFWDMMYMQVEDLGKRFKNLDDLKANNWQEVIPAAKPVVKRGRGRPKKVASTSTLKEVIKAARKTKKANEEENHIIVPQSDEVKLFSGGYYLIKSPVKQENIPAHRHTGGRRSLRVSLLTTQVVKRYSSPGLTMMKVSQAIKHGDGLTPSRSILKNDPTKSGSRQVKSVLFKDDLVKDIDKDFKSLKINADINPGKENDFGEINLITFSPQTTTRRSQRLARIK